MHSGGGPSPLTRSGPLTMAGSRIIAHVGLVYLPWSPGKSGGSCNAPPHLRMLLGVEEQQAGRGGSRVKPRDSATTVPCRAVGVRTSGIAESIPSPAEAACMARCTTAASLSLAEPQACIVGCRAARRELRGAGGEANQGPSSPPWPLDPSTACPHACTQSLCTAEWIMCMQQCAC